jgi:hypothetical protein
MFLFLCLIICLNRDLLCGAEATQLPIWHAYRVSLELGTRCHSTQPRKQATSLTALEVRKHSTQEIPYYRQGAGSRPPIDQALRNGVPLPPSCPESMRPARIPQPHRRPKQTRNRATRVASSSTSVNNHMSFRHRI